MALDRVRARFAGADPDGLIDLRYKYLAIADAARLGRATDRLDRRPEILVRDDDFDLHLRQKVDDILCPAIELGVALLPAEALRFKDGNALNSRFLQRFLYFVELERLDDRLDLFHFGETPHPRASRRRSASGLGRESKSARAAVNSIGSRIALRAPARTSGMRRRPPRRLANRQSGEISGGRSDGRSPFARAEDPPGRKSGLCDHRSAGLGDRDKMSEDARIAPRHRLLWRADGAVFVAVRVLHEDRADDVGAQLPRQIAKGQPFALEVAADLWARGVNRTAAANATILAQRAGWLFEMRDLQRGAAHRTRPTGFSRRRRHPSLSCYGPDSHESERADRMSLSPFRREREADLHVSVESDARLAVRRGLKRAPHRQRKERSDGQRRE